MPEQVGLPPPPLWPFPAAQEITEVLEWRTDVLQARSGEQRIALRPRPREIVTFRHRLDALGMARAAELTRAGFAGDWHVPLWHMALQPDADLAQGAMEIPLDTGLSDFRVGGYASVACASVACAGVAMAGEDATAAQIAAIQPDRLILSAPLVLPMPGALVAAGQITVAPIRAGLMSTAVEISRRRQGDGTVSVTFLLRDALDIAAPVLPTYLGRPVQVDPSLLRQPLSANLRLAVEYIDNGFGPVVVEPIRDLFERRDTITLKAQDAANRWALRRWLWSLRGRQASFWLPTWGNELQLRAPMSAGATLMRVAPIGPVAQLIGRRIALEVGDALRFRTITAAIEDGLEHRLSLSSSPGTPMPLGTKVHLMTLVRADTDRVEISHGVGASEVSLPIVEVST